MPTADHSTVTVTKPLSIAMFLSADPSVAGGIQEHVYRLSQELEKLGHQVTVFGSSTKLKYPFTRYYSYGNRFAMPLPNGDWVDFIFPTDDKKKLIKHLSHGQFDVVHVHAPYVPLMSWDVMRSLKLPIVTTFHTCWQDESVFKALDTILPLFQPVFSKHVKAAIFVSKIAQKKWATLCGPKVSMTTIHNGVDAMFAPIPKTFPTPASKPADQKFTILFLSRLVKNKGPDYAIEMMAKLRNKYPLVKLQIVGDGPIRPNLKKLVQKYHLQNQVEFLGEVTGPKKVALYQNADCFCAPYADEGFGLTVLEAMACGLPIIGFRNQAFAEVLFRYPAPQLLVANKSVPKLAQAVETLIAQPKLQEKLNHWVVKKSQTFSWQKNALQTLKVYSGVPQAQ